VSGTHCPVASYRLSYSPRIIHLHVYIVIIPDHPHSRFKERETEDGIRWAVIARDPSTRYSNSKKRALMIIRETRFEDFNVQFFFISPFNFRLLFFHSFASLYAEKRNATQKLPIKGGGMLSAPNYYDKKVT
jgi:hypothetical protein